MADGSTDQHPPVLVFVHIPKTAGTALNTVLRLNEPGQRTRSLPNVFKGGGGLAKGPMERLRTGKGRRHVRFSKPGEVRILRGHVPLGIREYLPSYFPADRDLRYFTFLREPVDRLLSHYFKIREKREGSLEAGKFGVAPLPPEPTLDDMFASGYAHDNLHTRMLSGLPEPFGEVTDEMLEQAKENLSEGLVFFGLTERFDESLVLAKRRLGFHSILANPSGRVRRVNPARPRGDQVPAELIEEAKRCNQYDIELYRHAEELFDRAPELGELEFQVEVAALRAAKAEGEIELDVPAPQGFGGDEDAWRMLLHARAMLIRQTAPRVAIEVPHETPDSELELAYSKVEELKREVRRLKTAAVTKRDGGRGRRKTGQGAPKSGGGGKRVKRQTKTGTAAGSRSPKRATTRHRGNVSSSQTANELDSGARDAADLEDG